MAFGIEPLFYGIWFSLSLWAVFQLLLEQREPTATLAWVLFVTLVPLCGAILYFIFGPQTVERFAVKRKRKIDRMLADLAESPSREASPSSPRDYHQLDQDDRQIIRLAKRISDYPATKGNRLTIHSDPQSTLIRLHELIATAQRFIHLEYYILASDEVTNQLFNSLIDASQRGVEVRILYDALGSLSLKKIYFHRLIDNGIKIAGFHPFSALPQRLNFNFRNHRKILIIDGKWAFTGSANIGKQYLGKKMEGQWRDNFLEVEGPACQQLEDVFAKDWQFTTREDIRTPFYYPTSDAPGDNYLQVLESGPHTTFISLHQTLFLAINSARNRLWLTTPYFIPDSSMLTSLSVAGLRGVDVRLLLPRKNDSKLVQHASRSFYGPLLKAGVKIFEYQPKILHAKVLMIDNRWTILGSSNMDIRSFRLNFELNLLVYGNSFVGQVESLFVNDQAFSEEILTSQYFRRPLSQRLAENTCRLLSPLL